MQNQSIPKGVCADCGKALTRSGRETCLPCAHLRLRSPAIPLGTRFGKWEVIAHFPDNHRQVKCRCECGRICSVSIYPLKRGKSNSCTDCRSVPKHGLLKTPEYRVWHNMKQRCLNPKHPSFENYGGRGITISPEWADFSAFIADMGARPSEAHSLERKNNNGPYSADNCEWADWTTQCNNKRTCQMVTYNGVTLSVTQWSQKLGMSRATLDQRLRKGWSIERAFTEPLDLSKKHR